MANRTLKPGRQRPTPRTRTDSRPAVDTPKPVPPPAEAIAQSPAPFTPSEPVVRIPLETLLYLGAIALAALLRLALLTGTPLSISETGPAIAAMDFVRGQVTGSGAPLPEFIAAVFFFVAGASDLAARLGPAIAGIALIAMLPLFQRYLGRLTCIVAAYLLAFSPFFLGVSRRLDGDAYAELAALVILLAVFRYAETRSPVWLGSGLVALSLLLLAGPRAVTFLLAGIAAVAVARAVGVATPVGALVTSWRTGEGKFSTPFVWTLGAAAVLYVAIGSRLFLNPRGLALPTLGEWVTEFNSGGGPALPIIALLSYEPLATVFAIVGLAGLFRRTEAEPRDRLMVSFLGVWVAAGMLVLVLGGQRLLGPLSGVTLPLTLLAAAGLADLLVRVRTADLARTWVLAGALPLLVFAGLYTAQLAHLDVANPAFRWLVVGLCLVLVIGYAAIVVLTAGARSLPVVALAAAALLMLVSVHSTVELNFRQTPAEWVLAEVPGPAATIFPQQLAGLAAQKGGFAPYGLPASLRTPFGWYLRDRPGLLFTGQFDPDLAAIILPESAPMPATGSSIVSLQSVYSSGTSAPPDSFRGFVRWFLWRDMRGSQTTRQAVLYSR